MPAVREAWTDERLDDLQSYMRDGFREIREDLREVKAEMATLRGELSGVGGEVAGVRGEVAGVRGEVAGVRGEVAELRVAIEGINRHLQIQSVVFATLFAAVLGLLGSQL